MPETKLQFTNLDKIFWPKEKYTKGDVINYYKDMARYLLPYLQGRPENLNRHPNGIKGKNFYQKDVNHTPPAWIKTVKIHSESTGANVHYIICQDKETLLYMANLGCIEINPWNSKINHLDKPDYLIMDLDPVEISFEKVIEVAQAVHKILEGVGAANYCKTSGKTGLHIYIPLGAKYSYEQSRRFGEIIARLVNKKLPKITSIERRPSKRRRKVYLDWLQNSRGQTLAAPFSLRPWPGATVATPLEWGEVKKGLDPVKFNIKTIKTRLKKKGDIFKKVLGRGANLKKTLVELEKSL